MSDLTTLLRETVSALGGHGIGHALVGGLAVSVRTEPRFTRDIDLAVAVASDAEAEAVVSALQPPFGIASTLEHETLGRLATVRLHRAGARAEGPVVDLLFASSGIEQELVVAAQPLEVLPGVVVPVARTGHLLVLKLLSRSDRRPQDEVDLQALAARADEDEWQRAEDAAVTVVAIGADRGRDLVADLAALRSAR